MSTLSGARAWASEPPRGFLEAASWHGAASETVRNLATAVLGWAMLWLVGWRATVIVTASAPERWPRDLPVVRLPLGGLGTEDLERLAAVPLRRNAHPFRVGSVGPLLGWKGIGAAYGLLRACDKRSRTPSG